MKKIIFVSAMLLASGITFSQSISQELVSSSGATYKNASYQLDWSIGEVQTETFGVRGQIITQGFHQNNYTVTVVTQINELQFNCIVYPNPTTDLVYLKTEGIEIEKLKYIISDLNGKILKDEKLIENNQQINFSDFTIGTYFISIRQGKNVVKTFKIIKY